MELKLIINARNKNIEKLINIVSIKNQYNYLLLFIKYFLYPYIDDIYR